MSRVRAGMGWSRLLAVGVSVITLFSPACRMFGERRDECPAVSGDSVALSQSPAGTPSPYAQAPVKAASPSPAQPQAHLTHAIPDLPPPVAEPPRILQKPDLAAALPGPAPHQSPEENTAPPPRSTERPHPLVEALRAYLNDRPHEAIDLLSVYEPKDQELLLSLLPVIAWVAKEGAGTEGMGSQEKRTLLEVLRSLLADLRPTAPLEVEKLVFCRQVAGFGRFDPCGNQFKPGDRVLIYVEMQNLAERRSQDQRYVTRLSSTLEIRRPDGKRLTVPVKSLPDWSWSPRQDHFTQIRFDIPANLEPGNYTLGVHIVDGDTGRSVEKSLGFRVLSTSEPRPTS